MAGQSAESSEIWRSYATICRLCLQKDGFMLGIFNNVQGKDKSISKKIVDCTALSVHQGDGLPNVICHRCLYKIEFCLEFRQLCFLSDATLRQFHGNSHQISNKEDSTDAGSSTIPQPLFEQLVNGGDEENVVMVVDPNQMDYDSDAESENDRQSDPEPPDLEDDLNETNDARDDPRDVTGRAVSLCRYCDHAFTDYQECMEHEGVHNQDQPYSCLSCSMHFADRMLYSAHMKSVHKNDKPYNCPQCSRSFARRSDLRKHTIVHTGVKPYSCPICLKSFSRNTNLSKHMRIHSGAKPFVCPKCPRTFISKGDLNRHALIHTGQKPFRCRFCHLAFSRRDKMLRHEKRHQPQSNQQPKAKSHVEDNLQDLHRASKESNLERNDLNSFRDSEYIEDSRQEEQNTLRTAEKSEENMIINLNPFGHGVASGSESNLQKSNTSLNGQNVNNQTSEVNEEYMKEEMQSEGEEAEQSDDESDSERIKENSSMTESRPFQCSQCPKRFSTAEFLKMHTQAKHTGMLGIRPFNCTFCNKSFIRKREMERHLTVHTGFKPFKCPKCLKGFGRKDKLVRHIRIHDRPGLSLKNGFFGFSSPEKKRPICLTRDK